MSFIYKDFEGFFFVLNGMIMFLFKNLLLDFDILFRVHEL